MTTEFTPERRRAALARCKAIYVWMCNIPGIGPVKDATAIGTALDALDAADKRIAGMESAMQPLVTAARAILANIEHWLETGVPATPDESKRLYESLKAAAEAAEANRGAAGREGGDEGKDVK